MNLPDLSVELRFWVLTHLRGEGGAYVFRDGVSFDALRAAVQAAWLAADRVLALELAQRYDMGNVLCLCCASDCSAGYRLCGACFLEEYGEGSQPQY